MNYYEYRLNELKEAIILLSPRSDCNELVESLKAEREEILRKLKCNE